MSNQVFYLINENCKPLFHIVSPDTVLAEGDFNKIPNSKDDIEAIVILAELNWQGKEYKDFYGFEIALELRRRYKLLCPLIIISILGQSYFEKLAENQIKFKILFGRGTAFLSIADKMNDKIEYAIQHLNQYPLSSSVLTDMNEMLLDQKGFVIDKLTHDLRVGKNKIEINTVLDETAKYLNNRQRNAINWNGFKSELTESLDNPYDFNKIKEDLILKCDQELIGEKVSGSTPSEKKHKLIVLEDDPDFRKRIKKNLKDYFEEVIVKEKAEDVIDDLDKDETNAITGIIADWRLYKDYSKKSYWQLQGYEVLNYAAKKRFIALFSLTSLHDRNVNNIRNELGLEVHLFKKQHLESEGKVQWDMMADTVKQKCDLITYLIASQPTGKRWKTDYYDRPGKKRITIKSLQAKYIEKKNYLSWKSYEKDISERSTVLWNYYNEVLDDDIVTISGFTSVKDKFGYKIAAKKPDLKHILIVRRIYLALILSAEKINQSFETASWSEKEKGFFNPRREENPLVNVYCVLNGTNWEEFKGSFSPIKDKRKGYQTKPNGEKTGGVIMTPKEQASEAILSKSKLFANLLCITVNDLPGKGILPEEQNWLLSINIDTSEGNSVLDYKAY